MSDYNFVDSIRDSFEGLINGAIEYIPRILAALFIFIIGLIIADTFARIVRRALKFIEDNKHVKAWSEKLGLSKLSVSNLVGMFVKWAILLIFISAAVNSLGVAVLSDTFNQIVAFMPKIFAAAVIGGITYVAANIAYDLTSTTLKEAHVKAYAGIAQIAKIVVLVFGIPLAAAQLGLDLTIINNNITIIVAGIMLTFAIAFGFGGKDVAGKILEDQYKKLKK